MGDMADYHLDCILMGDVEDDGWIQREPVNVGFLKVLNGTEKAYCFEFRRGISGWLPKSQITVDWEKKEITMPQWLYDAKGLK